MINWLKKIENTLLSNTLWIHLTLLLFISYLLMIGTEVQSLFNFVCYFMCLLLLFFPTLFFAAGRDRLKEHFSITVFQLLWGYCFVVHPLLMVITREWLANPILLWAQSNPVLLYTGEFLLTVSGFVLLTELLLHWNSKNFSRFKNSAWLQGLKFEYSLKLILGLVALVRASFFCINALFQEEVLTLGKVLWSMVDCINYTGQLFLISLVYYFFYYVNRYFMIPKILKQKGIIYYGFSIAGIILTCYPIFVFLIRLLPVVELMELTEYAGNTNLFANSSGAGPFTVMVLSLPVIISLEWFKQSSKLSILEKEKSLSELNFLKQQINPHFFFNTLNNLYALSITKDARTPEVVLQLSELMRYVIYRGKERLVALQEELAYIEDYIELQKIRLHKQLDYRFEREVETAHLAIPPLLFIVLIENAFKHGIEPAEGASYLQLSLRTKNDTLYFSCENSCEVESTTAAGIGLENLRRRLALSFPNRHELTIEKGDGYYKVNLILQGLGIEKQSEELV